MIDVLPSLDGDFELPSLEEAPVEGRATPAAYSERASANIHVNTPTRELTLVRSFAPIAADPCGNPTSTVGAAVEFWGSRPSCDICGESATHGVGSTRRPDRCSAHVRTEVDPNAAIIEREVIPLSVCLDPRYGRDGLAESWPLAVAVSKLVGGIVFLQPPYGAFIVPWIAKANAAARLGVEIVGLFPGRFDTKWFRAMRPDRICWYGRRIPFADHSKPTQKDSAKFPSVFPYWGRRTERFERIFGEHGVVTPWQIETGREEKDA